MSNTRLNNKLTVMYEKAVIMQAAIDAIKAARAGGISDIRLNYGSLAYDRNNQVVGWTVGLGGQVTVMWLESPVPAIMRMEPWIQRHGHARSQGTVRTWNAGARRSVVYQYSPYTGEWTKSHSYRWCRPQGAAV